MRYKAREVVMDLAWVVGVVALVYGVWLVSVPASIIVGGLLVLAHVFAVASGRERSNRSSGGANP